jgi:hypothetical protein
MLALNAFILMTECTSREVENFSVYWI